MDPVAIATLIFAAMAGLGSLVRVIQNERHHRFMKRVHGMGRGEEGAGDDCVTL